MRLPIRLEKCPLIDCIIEVRFDTNIVNSAVFGVIYNQIRSDYPGAVNNLPISQLPEAIPEAAFAFLLRSGQFSQKLAIAVLPSPGSLLHPLLQLLWIKCYL